MFVGPTETEECLPLHPALLFAVAFGAATAVALLALPVRRAAIRLGAVAPPGGRHRHPGPTPILGGVAIVIGATLAAVLGLLFGPFAEEAEGVRAVAVVGGAALALLFLGVLDDLKGLSWRPKLAMEAVVICGAFVLLGGGPQIDFGFWIVPGELWLISFGFSVFWVLTIANAYNFIDGLDGLAAGLGGLAAAALSAIALLLGNGAAAVALAALCGALGGFLVHNRHPARLFMGDAGALPVGFLLGILGVLAAEHAGAWAFLPVGIALGVPLADVTLTVVRRVLHPLAVERTELDGRPGFRIVRQSSAGVFAADRAHLHHRLLDLRKDPRDTVRVLLYAGLLLSVLAVAAAVEPGWALWITVSLILAVVLLAVRLLYVELDLLRRGLLLPLVQAAWLRDSRVRGLHDFSVVAIAWLAVHHLVGPVGPEASLPWVAGVGAALVMVLAVSGFYRRSFRQAGVLEAARAAGFVLLSALFVAWTVRILSGGTSSGVLWVPTFALMASLLVVGPRLSFRVLDLSHARVERRGPAVLLFGAGRRGVSALEAILRDPQCDLRPVGFLDDDPSLEGRIVRGLPVFGGLEALPLAVEQSGARILLVTTSHIPEMRGIRLAELCHSLGLERRLLAPNLWQVPPMPEGQSGPSLQGGDAPGIRELAG